MTPAACKHPLLFIDCFSGIAGDMMLAALLDLDKQCETAIRDSLVALEDLGLRLVDGETFRAGIRARTVRFEAAAPEDQPARTMADIRRLLEAHDLRDGVRARAISAFEAVAEAEGLIHGRSAETVHFHEVGALDSIGDFVGVAAGLEYLDAEVHCARVPLGRGFVQCRHGTIPVPAPATLALLEGLPVEGTEIESELVTPTGAAILRTQVTTFGVLPPMRPRAIGWGAGKREHAERPGLLRLVLGERLDKPTNGPLVVMEANIDDMTPELAAHCISRALEEGALDAWVVPITMKKGRPAIQLGILARPHDRERLAALLFEESTTIGLRAWEVERFELPREVIQVETSWGVVDVKIAGAPGAANIAPEFDSCREVAQRAGVPLKLVAAAALAAALERSSSSTRD